MDAAERAARVLLHHVHVVRATRSPFDPRHYPATLSERDVLIDRSHPPLSRRVTIPTSPFASWSFLCFLSLVVRPPNVVAYAIRNIFSERLGILGYGKPRDRTSSRHCRPVQVRSQHECESHIYHILRIYIYPIRVQCPFSTGMNSPWKTTQPDPTTRPETRAWPRLMVELVRGRGVRRTAKTALRHSGGTSRKSLLQSRSACHGSRQGGGCLAVYRRY